MIRLQLLNLINIFKFSMERRIYKFFNACYNENFILFFIKTIFKQELMNFY